MRIMKYLGFKNKSAQVAKDRLRIIIAQQRAEKGSPDYLPMLRKEIMDVVTKYVKVNMNQIAVDFHSEEGQTFLELNVTLPGGQDSAE